MAAQLPLGWWMVHSGLHRELMANKEKPGVSQYRMGCIFDYTFLDVWSVFLQWFINVFEASRCMYLKS